MRNDIESSKDRIFNILGKLYEEYKLPVLNINEAEWDSFIEVLNKRFYKKFKSYKKELKDSNLDIEYDMALNIIIRRAYNNSLLDNSTEFNLYYLMSGLTDLVVFHFSMDEINEIMDIIIKKAERKTNKKYIKR